MKPLLKAALLYCSLLGAFIAWGLCTASPGGENLEERVLRTYRAVEVFIGAPGQEVRFCLTAQSLHGGALCLEGEGTLEARSAARWRDTTHLEAWALDGSDFCVTVLFGPEHGQRFCSTNGAIDQWFFLGPRP